MSVETRDLSRSLADSTGLSDEVDSDVVGRTILVVDPASQDRGSLAQVLRHKGYQVLETASGETAVDVAIRESPDVIVLEVTLPGMDGFEVCEQIKTHVETEEHRR